MPHAFPPYIKEYLKEHLTPLTATHKMWWMRCEIMQVEPMMSQTKPLADFHRPISMPYFRIAVRDIDAMRNDKSGYAFDTRADVYKDFRPQDRISLFGHEPLDATYVSYPRFFYHHEIKVWGACYQTKYLDLQQEPVMALKVEKTGGFIKRVTGGVDLRPLYTQIAGSIDLYVHHEAYADPAFACKNPRPENQGGGALVD